MINGAYTFSCFANDILNFNTLMKYYICIQIFWIPIAFCYDSRNAAYVGEMVQWVKELPED